MNQFQTFQVFPAIPEELSFVETLSRNMWWTWQHDAKELFRRVDPAHWEKSRENPLAFSSSIRQEHLQELAGDQAFLSHLAKMQRRYEELVLTPYKREGYPDDPARKVAYFSMEFGIHESLPLFAGGLGVLAGDHLKAASDLGLPLVGVSLLYRQGYFRQFLNHEGWQQEEYPETNLYHLPLNRAKDPAGNELFINLPLPQGAIQLAVWRVDVGRIPLYLLDANVRENPPEFRDITARLYAADGRIRATQEFILGVGGMQALEALGIEPAVCHMNEGHSAFASLQRLERCMRMHSLDLATAMECVPRTTVFTTHTPVPAGHDEFHADMIRPFFTPLTEGLGVDEQEILSWGQAQGAGPDAPLSMFVLALRMSAYCNGVSKLHGAVARRMWSHLWPGLPEQEVPIRHVTNGVHATSWLSAEHVRLFERYMGPDWDQRLDTDKALERIDAIYDEELWSAHDLNRSRLIRCCREKLVHQYGRRNAPRAVMEAVGTALEQDILTIGFARRFATYKRAYLLFMDPDRLEALITNNSRPVQFIFAGKAHPRDNEGKGLIKQLVEFASRPRVRRRLVFIEDYDMHLARHLIQGADVWLNTPRRPYEACGTSGMKAAANGVLHLSALDGWWVEGYSPDRGWAVGNGEEYEDWDYQDALESQALYNILENDLIPAFYDRKDADYPARWVSMMKNSMKCGIRDFSARRMVKEYEDRYYLPAIERGRELLDDDSAVARQLQEKSARIKSLWDQVKVGPPQRDRGGSHRVGESFVVTSEVFLGELSPREVNVHLYYGSMKTLDDLDDSVVETMLPFDDLGEGRHVYRCTISCKKAGRYGFTARAMPAGDDRLHFSPGFITWA